MESLQIPFSYFYGMFQEQFRKNVWQQERRKIGETADELDDMIDFFLAIDMSTEEQLALYDQSFMEVCTNYVSTTDAPIDVIPTDPFEFTDLILDTMQENVYKESFLFSLQFIYQNYLECLGKGSPTLMECEDNESISHLQITLDSHYQIVQFESVNMDLLEQDKLMTKVVSMEKNQQLGPYPKVLLKARKDI